MGFKHFGDIKVDMKKLIAKLCIWILGKLGYSNDYYQKNTIVISVDATEAIKQLERFRVATIKLSDELAGIKPITPTI